MHRLSSCEFGVLLLALFGMPELVAAQPLSTHRTSIQWLAQASDAVVLARILDVRTLNEDDPFVRPAEVRFCVQRCLKGRISGTASFVLLHGEAGLQEFTGSGRTVLLFLSSALEPMDGKGFEAYLYRYPWRCLGWRDVADRRSDPVSWQSGDAVPLSGDALIRAVRTACQRRTQESIRIRLPNAQAFTGFDTFVTVPLTQEVLALAHRWRVAGGVRARIGEELLDEFTPIRSFEEVQRAFDLPPPTATTWRRSSTLSWETLEWMAADSDLIVCGVIEEAVLVQLAVADGQTYEASLDRHLIRFRIHHRLKGRAPKRIALHLDNGGKVSQWCAAKTPLVLFVKDNLVPGICERGRPLARGNQPTLRYRGRSTGQAAVIAMDAEQPALLNWQFERIHEPAEMVQTVRDFLQENPSAAGRVRALRLPPPAHLLAVSPWKRNEHVHVCVPLVTGLEATARAWTGSADHEERFLGAVALGYFPNQENRRRFLQLRSDPGRWPRAKSVSRYHVLKGVHHAVRYQAWATLRAWGDEQEPPPW